MLENNTYSYKLLGKDFLIFQALIKLLKNQTNPDKELISKLEKMVNGNDTRQL